MSRYGQHFMQRGHTQPSLRAFYAAVAKAHQEHEAIVGPVPEPSTNDYLTACIGGAGSISVSREDSIAFSDYQRRSADGPPILLALSDADRAWIADRFKD